MTRRKPPALHVVRKPPPLSEPSVDAAAAHLALLGARVHALRVLGGKRFDGRPVWRTEGYFDSTAAAADAACAISREGADAVYVVLQPIDPECLHRSVNAFGGKGVAFVSDADVTGYRALLIDLDPVRPAGVSSTAEELEDALRRADEIVAWLTSQGWPVPLYVLGSGNGAHVVYRVRAPKSPANVALLRGVLGALDARWSDDRVHVDTKVYNPGRITKLAGTWARKGDSTRERPHRVAWLERTDARTTPVPLPVLRALAGLFEARGAKERRAPTGEAGEDGVTHLLTRFEERGLAPKAKDWGGKTLIDVRCWRQDHGHRSGYVIVTEGRSGGPDRSEIARPARSFEAGNGATPRASALTLFARCHHADCDATTENLLAFLGWEGEDAEGARFDPDAAREIVAAVNATGLVELWEGRALLYVVTDPESGERVLRNPQTVRTFLDRLPRLTNDDGSEMHAFSVWTRHADKRLAWGSAYETMTPFGAISGEGKRARVNRWQGFAYGEARGDATPTSRGKALVTAWREHLHAHIAAGRRDVAEYLWRLCAWKVQHPTEVPLVFIVLTGAQGSGKNTFALPLVNLFGAHGLHSQSPLSRFNVRMEGTAMVYHDEAEFLAAAQTMRALKAFVTEQQLTYESKGIDTYQGVNLAMHVAASNDARIHVEPTDRRVVLLRTRAPAKGAAWFQKAGLDGIIGRRELERPESREFHTALLDALARSRLPAEWRPFPAPETEERAEAIEEHLPALEAWVWHALQRGVIPGLSVPGRGPEEWQRNRAISPDERQAAWGAFRESLTSSSTGGGSRAISPRTEGVAGFNSFAGFSRRLLVLLDAETRVVKREGKTVRVWILRSLERARAACTAALLERGVGG